MEGETTTWVAIQKEGTRVGGGCIYAGVWGGCICAVEKLEGTCGASLGWSRAEGQSETEKKRKDPPRGDQTQCSAVHTLQRS